MTASRDVAATTDETLAEPAHQPYSHLAVLLAEFTTLGRGDPLRRVRREELITGYLPVAHHIARRYSGRNEPTDDLEQAASIGLLNALERFDPGRGVDFLGYAVPTITGEVRRHFRDTTWSMRVPRRLKDLQGPIREAIASLSSTLRRAPRPSELAAWLDVPAEHVVEAINASHAYTAGSLDALAGPTDVALGDVLGRMDAEMTAIEDRESIRHALNQLPDRERAIVVLRFFDDLTQTEISAEVGVSQIHVSRLLGRSLATLRMYLDADR